tara:strand:- start:315 stop:743 length:429 start_codon:yes stop_codon:yes gene_type:complete
MAIVNEKHSSAKPIQVDPKTGKPMPQSATPVRTTSPTLGGMGGEDANGGFFGSFFASKNKKKMAAMEAPPPTLKASGTLSEREGIEVEVISELPAKLRTCWEHSNIHRTSHQLILQYREKNNDRHGTESNHAQSRPVSTFIS